MDTKTLPEVGVIVLATTNPDKKQFLAKIEMRAPYSGAPYKLETWIDAKDNFQTTDCRYINNWQHI